MNKQTNKLLFLIVVFQKVNLHLLMFVSADASMICLVDQSWVPQVLCPVLSTVLTSPFALVGPVYMFLFCWGGNLQKNLESHKSFCQLRSHSRQEMVKTLVSGDAPARKANWAPIQDSGGGMGAGDSAAASVVLAGESGHVLARVAACSAQENRTCQLQGPWQAGSSRNL